jgi:EAL domain-containing protein (putative c-di-GMP-specific phosphodiesterase class I)
LSVIVEGVENEEQCEFSIRIACNAFRGNFFSRPLALDEFESQWISTVRSGT